MFRILKRAACAVCALVVMAAVSVSAFADYTYSIDDKKLCDEIQADTSDINGTEGTFNLSKWIAFMYSFKSNSSSLFRKFEMPSVLLFLPLSSQFCILSNLFELSESSS